MNRPGLICFQTRRSSARRFSTSRRVGFTLIELLVAVTLTLIMMAAVVQIFALVGRSINNSRSTLEMSERIRAVTSRLRLDLEGVTADMTPPGRPEEGKGYFEYIEGPIGPVVGLVAGFNTDEGGIPDSTVGDRDDILQFTTRSRGEPFVGRGLVINNNSGTPERVAISSQVAEVAWFLRGTTLYRRVLLISPSFDADIRLTLTPPSPPRQAEIPLKSLYRFVYRNSGSTGISRQMGYYNNYDLSVHWDATAGNIVCNTLADLTRRECRYAHPPFSIDGAANGFPHALHLLDYGDWQDLGLPTLQECSHAAWPFPINGRMPYTATDVSAVVLTPGEDFDAWVNPYPFPEIDKDTGSINLESSANPPEYPDPPGGWPAGTPPPPLAADSPRYVGPRVGEDVILTNVLSFDVKAWDPRAPILLTPANVSLLPGDANYSTALDVYNTGAAGAPVIASEGAYVDLGYSETILPNLSNFSGMPHTKSDLETLRIWDTWSIHYEHDGRDQDGVDGNDQGTNGFDDNNDGVVDDPGEMEAPPPYPYPLRGIQIKIRVFDPDSQQIREVTIQHDFMNR